MLIIGLLMVVFQGTFFFQTELPKLIPWSMSFWDYMSEKSLESKLFATSPEDAARFGRDSFRFDEVPFHIIEVQVPTQIADRFEQLTLDFKPAVNVSRELLSLLNHYATVREITPIPTR